MTSPATKHMRLSASGRTSLTARTSLQGASSALPRPTQPLASSRQASTQPTYDFISGGEPEHAPPERPRPRLRQPSISRLDNTTDENLRVRMNTLDYENKNLKQERDYLKLQYEKEMRDLQAKADADFKKYQTSENAASKAAHRNEVLQKELKEKQDQHVNEKAALNRQVRDLQDQTTALKEDAEDAQARLSDQDRQWKYQLNDVESKRAALQQTVDSVQRELQDLSQSFDAVQKQLVKKTSDYELLEAQNLELKSHTGDSDTLGVVQGQLSEQIDHIRQLETTNRKQLEELRMLRDAHRSVQVVEEQRRGLETELQVLKDVERQLGEAQIQKEILEDEKRQWTTLLERDGQDVESDTPEGVVRSLVQARIELVSWSERMGSVEADVSEKDEMIRALEAEKTALRNEVDKAKSSQGTSPETTDGRAYRRIQRQANLAVKEVEYLRAQLKSLDAEETTMMDNAKFDSQRADQVKQLESLIDQYRDEISTLQSDMLKLESAPPTEPRGTKRRAESQEPEEDSSSQVGPLLRKNKNLQVALQKTTQQSKILATELQATKAQLKGLRESTKTRVLELRDNPTASSEALKMSTIRTLKEENQNLLSHLRGKDLQGVKVVPVSSLDALQLDLDDKDKVIAEKDKRLKRQKEIWTNKTAEFQDVIASVLGWRIKFLPSGKARVSSIFHASADSDEDDAQYIEFDGENATMKISGGTEGPFAKEVKQQMDFWLKEKNEVPCLLAALTIQFHDEYRSG